VTIAIPTRYGGTQFRSRLEARWAAFFDLLGWSWEYEPIDLDGYIPDFIVEYTHKLDGKPYHVRRLVEVKPALALDEFMDAIAKIENSGWEGIATVVGAKLFSRHDCAEYIFQLERDVHATCPDFWQRYRSDITDVAAGLSSYITKDNVVFSRTAGVLGEVMQRMTWRPLAIAESRVSAWREAGNRVQWRAPEAT
jgi:hypothetical protein